MPTDNEFEHLLCDNDPADYESASDYANELYKQSIVEHTGIMTCDQIKACMDQWSAVHSSV